MIYAIRAVGTEFIKFGRASHIGRRLNELDCASPHELEIVQTAEWQNGAETAIHRLLAASRHKGEWFKDCALAQDIIKWMANRDAGLARLHAEVRKLGGRPKWLEEGGAKPIATAPETTKPDGEIPCLRRMEREEWWKKHGHRLERT